MQHLGFQFRACKHMQTVWLGVPDSNCSEERLQEPKLAGSDEWRRLLAAKDVDTQVLIEAWT